MESTPATPRLILPFDDPGITLETAGGKGASLARMARSGYPVPAGFVVATAAYQVFVDVNRLEEQIQQALMGLDPQLPDSMSSLDAASAEIRSLFRKGEMPADMITQLRQAYAGLGSTPVAVRSSATAEDLPGLSFAGQQETFLNVVDEAGLLRAVVDCWSSLWTGRAIAYRARQGIGPEGLALAVVVQEMVQSEVSGVLFTANPITGLRSDSVIDASFGLGEAVVSGQVEPDHYVVDTAQERITHKTLGSKALAIRGQEKGGVKASYEEDNSPRQALPDAQILELARLGQRLAADYGSPQDIEWAWAGGRLFLLQSRPVTSLFPVPDGMPSEPLEVLFSFGAVQGMLDPMTPLGADILCLLFAAGSGLFGYHNTPESQRVVFVGGERLWVRFTPLLHNTLGRKVVRAALPMVEPSILQALDQVWDDPRIQPEKKGTSFQAKRRLMRFFPRLAANALLNVLAPQTRRKLIQGQAENILLEMERRFAVVRGDRYERLLERIQLLPYYTAKKLPRMLVLYISGVASGMATFNLLNQLSKQLPQAAGRQSGWTDLALEASRGLPDNPTTEMDLFLWQTAQAIRDDTDSRQVFRDLPAADLASLYKSGALPAAAQDAIQRFIDKYGGRGLAEIDLGRPRWREDPAPVLQALGSYLQIEDVNLAPDAVFERGARQAEGAVEKIVAGLRQTHRGWIKAGLARWAARRVRALLGIREAPKFFAVRMMGLVRQALLESGGEFCQAGELDQPDDLLFLKLGELEAFGHREPGDWRARITGRRAAYNREALRRQIPRLLLSDGRAFYEGMSGSQGDAALAGAPVSPGVVEGRVRIIFDPRGAQILPGEIMVCPGTDPSWTPLFLAAGGLVMEVGGMMTHGAVVAREYGIPAVVGVHQATTRLKTGQRIRLDGSSGNIVVLEEVWRQK